MLLNRPLPPSFPTSRQKPKWKSSSLLNLFSHYMRLSKWVKCKWYNRYHIFIPSFLKQLLLEWTRRQWIRLVWYHNCITLWTQLLLRIPRLEQLFNKHHNKLYPFRNRKIIRLFLVGCTTGLKDVHVQSNVILFTTLFISLLKFHAKYYFVIGTKTCNDTRLASFQAYLSNKFKCLLMTSRVLWVRIQS